MTNATRLPTSATIDPALAQALHDIVVPQLFALSSGLTALQRDTTAAPALVRTLAEVADSALSDVRALQRGTSLTGTGPAVDLAQHLRRTLEPMAELMGCALEITARPAPTLHRAAADELVAIAREAIANATRHGGASTIDIGVEIDDELVVLTLLDDGRWRIPTDPASSGVDGMRARAHALGGTATIDRCGESTLVEVRLPHATNGPTDRSA